MYSKFREHAGLENTSSLRRFQITEGLSWRGFTARICKECGSGEVDDVSHWLLRWAAWEEL